MSDDIRIIKGYRVRRNPDGTFTTLGRADDGATFVPDATAPYDAPQAQETLRGSQLDNQGQAVDNAVTQGTARTTIQTNEAPAGTMWVDPNDPSKGVQAIPGYQGERLTPQIRADAIQAYRDAQAIRETVESLRRQYYRGPGQTKGIYSLGDYLPTDENKSFDDTGQRARGYVKRALGFTGGEGNTAAESEATYGPYLPTAGDKDGQIASKIAALEALGREAEARSVQLLGGIPDAQGNIQPVAEQERLNAMTYLRTDGGVNNKTPGAAGFGATVKSVPYPEMGQAEHDMMVGKNIAENNGRLDIDRYVRERAELDRQYLGSEAGPNAEAYRAWAEEVNTFLDNGGVTVPTGITPTNQKMSMTEAVRNSAVNNPLVAPIAGGVNTLTWGAPEALAGEGKMDALREAQPLATAIGEIGGAIGGASMAGYAGRKTLGKAIPSLMGGGSRAQVGRNLAADMVYGTTHGTVTTGDPMSSAVLSGVGSIGGQAVGKTLGGVVGGKAMSNAASNLRERGVGLTGGRIFGDVTSKLEDAAVSIPFVGDMVRRRSTESFEDLNRAMLSEAGSPTGFTPTAIGREGVEQLGRAKNQAYRDAVDGVSVPTDAQFSDDLLEVERLRSALPEELQSRFDKLMGNHTKGLTPSPLVREKGIPGTDFFKYNAGKGEPVEILVKPQDNGRTLEVAVDEMIDDGANRFGPSEMRRALSFLKQEYPSAERVTGLRISGAGKGRTQTIDIGGIRAADGRLTGDAYQRAMMGLKTARGKAGTVAGEFEQPYRDAVSAGMDSFKGLMLRGGGDDVVTGLRKADELNKNFKIVEDAIIRRARNGTRTGEVGLAAPSQFVDAAAASESKYGANSLRALAEDAQRVLPSKLPNSGTVDRAMAAGLGLTGLGAVGGGEMYLQEDLDGTAKLAGALALLTAGGTKVAQKAIEKALVARPDRLKEIGGDIRKYKRLFGSGATAPLVTYGSN